MNEWVDKSNEFFLPLAFVLEVSSLLVDCTVFLLLKELSPAESPREKDSLEK